MASDTSKALIKFCIMVFVKTLLNWYSHFQSAKSSTRGYYLAAIKSEWRALALRKHYDRIAEYAALEMQDWRMADWNLVDWKKTDCKLLNYMDIGVPCDTYIKAWLMSKTTLSGTTM